MKSLTILASQAVSLAIRYFVKTFFYQLVDKINPIFFKKIVINIIPKQIQRVEAIFKNV